MRAPSPAPEMLAVAERLAGFIAGVGGLDPAAAEAAAAALFADGPVTIVENFAPFVFEGPEAATHWAAAMRIHVQDLADLHYAFGPACDFSLDGERAFFTLPTVWRGRLRGRAFTEHGGWAMVLARQGGGWRLRAYGWAVTGLTFDG